MPKRVAPTKRGVLKSPISRGAAAAVGAVAVVLAVAALIFTNASTSEDLVGDALLLQGAEATLGANNVALKALTQAVLLAEDELLGVADEETAELAVAEANETVAELGLVASALQERLSDPNELEVATRGVMGASADVTRRLSEGRVQEAGALLSGEAKVRFEKLRDTVSVIRSRTAAVLGDANSLAGTMAAFARYVLAFLVPATAILAYRFIARRQLRSAEFELDTRLEAEREVVRAKDEFIANVSHELRTPLTSIYGFSEILVEEGMIDPEAARDLIGMINFESSELTRMVEDLLASARAESGTITYHSEPVSVPDEVETALAPLQRGGHQATVACSPVKVWGDPMRVRQIVRNLLANAHHHGGATIEVSGGPVDGKYVLTIADDGAGVPAAQEERLFTRFMHQGIDPLTTGTVGLGLAIVKLLVEGMDGDIRYERFDGWTRFIVRLALATSGVGSNEWNERPVAAAAFSPTESEDSPWSAT